MTTHLDSGQHAIIGLQGPFEKRCCYIFIPKTCDEQYRYIHFDTTLSRSIIAARSQCMREQDWDNNYSIYWDTAIAIRTGCYWDRICTCTKLIKLGF